MSNPKLISAEPLGYTRFGDAIRAWRKQESLSQREAAERIGVSKDSIRYWEEGMSVPFQDNLDRVAAITGIDVQSLNQERIS